MREGKRGLVMLATGLIAMDGLPRHTGYPPSQACPIGGDRPNDPHNHRECVPLPPTCIPILVRDLRSGNKGACFTLDVALSARHDAAPDSIVLE
jgi:hypothetical protein